MSVARRSLAPIAIAVLALGCEPDRGRCLLGHVVHHHEDAYPLVDLDAGTVSWVDAEDYDTTVCDRWEFPHGRAEKDEPR